MVPAEQLHAHPDNWRIHPDSQASALRGLLSEVGIVAPLIAYESERYGSLTLIDGHLRRDAGGTWPVTVLDVSDEEADLILATFDPLAELAERNDAILADLLGRVEMMPVEDAGVQALLTQLAEESGKSANPQSTADAEPQVDRAEELRQKWGVESGQLWQLGDHRLICGDCTDPDVVAKLLQGEKPMLMVTDPPYGVEYDASWRNEAAEKGLLAYAASRVGKVEHDDRADWSEAWALFPGDVVYCWHADRRASTVQNSLEANGFELRAQIIWRKPNFAISRGHYTYQHEPCWYAVRKGKTAHWIGPANASTVWEISLDKNAEGGHSTQKPLQCMARPIEYHDCDLVYEPFSGSGTTIIACEQLGRKCRAIEISPAYVAVALQRWADATGKTPQLVEAG